MRAGDLRVLIVAEHASKRYGGEAILPYHYFRVLRSRGVDAWLIVHERTRGELVALFPGELDRLRFVEDMTLQKIFYQVGKLLPRRISEATFGLANQLLTQFAQRAMVRELATRSSVVHQPIPVSPKFPSLLAGQGAPLVVGPMNGGMDYPAAFRGAEAWWSRWAIALGRSFSNVVNAVLSGKRNADVVLVANERTRTALPSGVRGRVLEVVENGVDLEQWPAGGGDCVHAPRFLFIGRLVDWKALDIAIEALGAVPGATLDVIGDGPMLEVWRGLAAGPGLTERVRFHGWLTQEQCAGRMAGACALVLPSIYECGGAVVLEAMAMGKPVIATDWGGPADYLDASCGILIEPTSRAAMVSGFAVAMGLLADDAAACARLGEAGRMRVLARFDWEKKVDTMMEIYRSVLPGIRIV